MFNLRSIPLGSIPDIQPVFVVGAGRSGTTPLQLALNMHSTLGVYGETQAFFVHRRFGAEPNEVSMRRRFEYWRAVVSGCCPYEDLLDSAEMRSQLASAPSYAHIVSLIMGAIAAREGKSRWGEKSPAHIFRLHEIRACFPNARIIHTIRDPRAVVSSSIKAFNGGQFTDWNAYAAARYWLRCFRVHAQQVSSRADGYMLVRYEDFVTRPKETLSAISSFLGMKFEEDMLNFHRVASDYVRPGRSGAIPAMHALTKKPLDPGRTDAWKQSLSPAQTKLIEQVAGNEMTTLGYEPVRRPYEPPVMRAYLSTRWAVSESYRILLKQAQAPNWAMRRAIDSQTKAPVRTAEVVSVQPPAPIHASASANKKFAAAAEPEGAARRSGT